MVIIFLLSNGGAPLLEEEGRNGAGYPALVAAAVSAEDRRLRVRVVVRGLEDQHRGGHRGSYRRNSQGLLRLCLLLLSAIAAVAVAVAVDDQHIQGRAVVGHGVHAGSPPLLRSQQHWCCPERGAPRDSAICAHGDGSGGAQCVKNPSLSTIMKW